jgi:hypothetical protein
MAVEQRVGDDGLLHLPTLLQPWFVPHPSRYFHPFTLERLYYHTYFRADSADVEGATKDYTIVGDAKAFRLSRTAKNQKDFKVTTRLFQEP